MMKISFSEDGAKVYFPRWVEVMEHSASGVTIGNNPMLPGIMHKTWGWPQVHIAFMFKGIPIGYFQALKINRSWVSLPHFDHGGIWVDLKKLNELISNGEGIPVSEQRTCQLLINIIHHVLTKIEDQKVQNGQMIVALEEDDLIKPLEPLTGNRSIVLKCRSKFPLLMHNNPNKVLSTLNLQDSLEAHWEIFAANVRRKIRKAYKKDIQIIVGGAELTKQFYGVYRKNIHQLGSFGLPLRFFSNLMEGYNFGIAKIILAKYNGKYVGSAILLSFLDYAENAWFASLKEGNNRYVTYALHNEMMKLAIKNRCSVYSFGRSTRDSGVHKYKKQWGVSDEVLYFNSTSAITDSNTLYRIAKPVIKILPQGVISIFDGPVSRIIY